MTEPSEFQELLDATPDAVVVVDQFGIITAVSHEAVRFLGWTPEELTGSPIGRIIPLQLYSQPGHALPDDSGSTVSCLARRSDGREVAVEVVRRPLGGTGGPRVLVTLRDLTHWRRTADARVRSHDEARAALQSIGDAVITTDAACRITFLNPVAESVTGWDAEEALGQPLDVVLPLISETTRQPVPNSASRCLAEGRAIDLEEGVLLLRRDGTEVPIGDSSAPILDQAGQIVGAVLVIQNESERRREGHRLSYEAAHDPLTGLINRREFERRLTRVVTGLTSTASEQMLLFLDLDRFKIINDTCGHDAGDDLLRSLGPLLSRVLRKRDTIARLGGDEFGILLENCPLADASRIAEEIRAGIEEYRFEWAGSVFTIGASIGLIPVTAEPAGIAAVLRAADAACYAAKEAGGNRVHQDLGPSGTSTGMARRATRLARAVDEGHFRLYGQAIVALDPGDTARPRFEVLLRLPDAQGRVQDAAEFLPQAERHHLMPAIDRWVIRECTALLGEWLRNHPGASRPVCSINLSASTLAEDSLLLVLEQYLSRYGIPSGSICFEITEAAALANLSRTVRFVSGIRTSGCQVALEDFGSGVTSFSYLKTLRVDFLKIGGAFVQGVADDPMYGSIVNAVNQIGRSLGIDTIAKQVGSRPALEKLRRIGVGFAQGRALTPPVPMTDAEGRMILQSLELSA